MTLEKMPTCLNIRSKGNALSAFLAFGIKCSRCGRRGHRRANCPLSPKQTTNPSQPHSSSHPLGALPAAHHQRPLLHHRRCPVSVLRPRPQLLVLPPPCLLVQPTTSVFRGIPLKTPWPLLLCSPLSGSASAAPTEYCSVVYGQSTPSGLVATLPAENTRAHLQEYPAPSPTHGAGKTRQKLEILLGQVPGSYLTEVVQLGLQMDEVKPALISEPALRSLEDRMTVAQRTDSSS
ncbi:hypothetical protein LAZ67_21001254 [Cordylochernes scorpioides]|uniref:CCHC-type domain-containing protein n=1 Tax=Cordylochernes scorpioides TaxID=51811 RepID=A0ABY6LR13_9ARAC|nr:hypothetical protein LAZ67_21001254 [Cordylochernes scorpioides]